MLKLLIREKIEKPFVINGIKVTKGAMIAINAAGGSVEV